MIKVKCGAIIKEISKGALKWYLSAGWKVIESKKTSKKEETEIIDDKTDTEEITTP